MLGRPLLHRLGLSLVLISLLAGCVTQSGDATPTPGVTRGTADVEEVELFLMESFPIQVAAVARGHLRDGCTEIDEVTSSFDAQTNTFSVEITTVRDSEAVCTEALVPFEERIELDVRGLPAGTYTVDVNGVQETFTFDVDNEVAEPTVDDVSWDEAKELILSGSVEQVTQLHSKKVYLDLSDGRQLVTTEPEIDAVFAVVDACGAPCENMVLATE